jgi:ATP-dependent helicase/nuclease subunit B
MPVRFVLGPAGSGKTHRCLEELRRLERERRPGIFLVPEQSTHSAERELLADPELPGLRHVQVLSFTRLAFRLREEAGVAEPLRIGDAVRTMLLRAVMARLPDETLGPLAPLRSRQGFLEELGRFIGEVRAHGTLDFLDAVRDAGSPKLRALGAVLEAYDTARRDLGLVDPEAALSGLEPLVAARASRLRETGIFIDGFLSWTRREREVLVALSRSGARIEIALCLDEGTRVPFAPAQRTLARMRELLAAGGVVEEPPVHLAPRPVDAGRFARPELVRLERMLHADEVTESGATGDAALISRPDQPCVRVVAAADPRRDVLSWARAIDRWIRLGPGPGAPESVAVILRSVEPYREAIRETFPAYGIPFFLDEPHRLLAHPWARLLLEALEILLSGWRRDAVIGFLRNPLLRCEPATVDLLENLSLEYGRDFEEWHLAGNWELFAPPQRARMARRREDDPAATRGEDEAGGAAWDGDADSAGDGDESDGGEVETEDEGDAGLGLGAAFTPGNAAGEATAEATSGPPGASAGAPGQSGHDPLDRLRAALAGAEEVRRGALLPLRRFELAWTEEESIDGAGAAARLRALEAELLAPGRPGARAPAWDDPRPEWTQRVASALEELLDGASRLWPAVAVTLEEFARALKQGIAAARVPAVPVRFGQVTIAEVQRSRLAGIRRVVVGGLNDGVFPRTIGAESVLDEPERRELESRGLALGPSASARQEEETWFGYVALTRAAEEVVLTFSRRDAAGSGLEPSLLVEEVRRVLPGLAEEPALAGAEALTPAQLQTPNEAADRLAAELAGEVSGARRSAEGLRPAGVSVPAGGAVAESDSRGASILAELRRAIDRPAPGALAHPSRSVLADVRKRFDGILPALDFHPAETLPPDLVSRALPGPVFETSVSRLTEFAKCPYLGFARGVLRLRPRPRAEVTPLETGTLAHAALEEFFRRPPVKDPGEIVSVLAEVFRGLEGRSEFRAFGVDRASEYRWNSTRRSLERFLRVETARLHGSEYRTAAFEDRFDLRTGNAVAIPLGEGRTLCLAGRIDRIDTRTRGEETLAVVIDYKRSARTGVRKDMDRGLDLQLVAYLLYLRQEMKWKPAGGLYVPVLPSPVAEERLKRGETNVLGIRAAGLVLQEERDAIDNGVGLLAQPRYAKEQFVGEDTFAGIVDQGKSFLASYAASLLTGWIPARPLEMKPGQLPCDNCDYGALCRFRSERDRVRHEPGEGMPVSPVPAPAGPGVAGEGPATGGEDKPRSGRGRRR